MQDVWTVAEKAQQQGGWAMEGREWRKAQGWPKDSPYECAYVAMYPEVYHNNLTLSPSQNWNWNAVCQRGHGRSEKTVSEGRLEYNNSREQIDALGICLELQELLSIIYEKKMGI